MCEPGSNAVGSLVPQLPPTESVPAASMRISTAGVASFVGEATGVISLTTGPWVSTVNSATSSVFETLPARSAKLTVQSE